MRKPNLWPAALLIPLLAAGLEARNVFVTSGDNVSSTVSVFSGHSAGDVLGPLGAFSATPVSTLVLSNLDGSKYYVIGRSATDTVVVVDGNFGNAKRRSLAQNDTGTGVITPDGNKVLIPAGRLKIIETSGDFQIADLDVNGIAIDVAVSLDGSRAFVLAVSGLTSNLTAIDVATGSILGAPLALTGNPTGVSVGPNGLAYVSTQNAIYEVDGRFLPLTVRNTIAVNALPGKLHFTPGSPDGTAPVRAVAVNKTPVAGNSTLLVFDLTNRTAPQGIPRIVTASGGSVVLDQVAVASNNRVFATAVDAAGFYEITLNPLNISGPSLGGVSSLTGVRSIALSSEVPAARYIYVATSNIVAGVPSHTLYRFDLNSNTLSGQASLSALPATVSYAGPAAFGSPFDAVQINTVQSVRPGEASLPLVVRPIDASGRPMRAVPVHFSTTLAGVTLQPVDVTTNGQGYAMTVVNVPGNAVGTFTVRAEIGGGIVNRDFSISVATGGGGGGGTPGTGGLSIFSGNGQVLPEFNSTSVTGNPLVAIVRDTAGNGVPGASVAFSLTSGSGTITSGPQGTVSSATGTQVVMFTDATGQASVHYLSSAVPPGLSFVASTISAATSDQSVNFIITATPSLGGGVAADARLLAPGFDNLSITGGAGQTLTGAIQVLVSSLVGGSAGRGIPNVGVRLISEAGVTGPTASCVGSTASGGAALTDANGVASCDLLLGGKVGTTTMRVDVGGFRTVPFQGITLRVNPGPPSRLNIVQGNGQSGNAGQRLAQALVAEVADAFGNLLSGTAVQWEVVTQNGATLSNVISTADSVGRVSALVTLGQIAGAVQVRVRVGSVSAVFNLTVNVTISRMTAVSGSGQIAVTGQAFALPLVVQVLDDRSQPVNGAIVAFAVTSGVASLTAASATTDAQGRASVGVTAGTAAGPIVVTATVTGSGGALSATFTLTSRLPGPVFTAASVVNTASNQPGVVPLGIVTIFAGGIAANVQGSIVPSVVGGGPLPTRLNNIEVLFGNSLAPIFAVSNINGQESVIVQAPGELGAPGTTTVTIRNTGGGSTTVDGVQVLRYQPGIFETSDILGRRYAVLLRADGSYVTPENPARRGEQLRMFVTGLGQVSPATASNRAGVAGQQVLAPVVIGVNNAGTRMISAEYAQGLIGVYVIVFEVPSDAPTATNVPLSMGVGDPMVFSNAPVIGGILP